MKATCRAAKGRSTLSLWLPAGAAVVLVFGCDLKEVVVPAGQPVVVVHAIMRPDLPEEFLGRQFIVVERSFSGRLNPADTNPVTGDTHFHRADSMTVPYGGYPSIPIEDALVWVSNLDRPDDPCGGSVEFLQDPGGSTKSEVPGVYWGPQNCPTMLPGDRLELRIETPEGEVVTGVTRIPAMAGAYVRVGGDSVVFGTDDTTVFNRDLDTLEFGIEADAGRLLQFEVRRLGDLTDFGTKIYVDTTAFALPASVVNTFVIGDEDDVFRAGRDYVVSVALTDSNYFDFSRSRNNSFTGHGFINHLQGGIGLFGSMVALSTTMRATGEFDDPREGNYRLKGPFGDTVTVDLDWQLYLARPSDSTEFSAFVEGRWLFRDIRTSADGLFVGDAFTAVLIDTIGVTVRRDTLRGLRQADSPWQVILFGRCDEGEDGGSCGDERVILFRGLMEQK